MGIVVVDDDRVKLLLGDTANSIQIASALYSEPKLAQN